MPLKYSRAGSPCLVWLGLTARRPRNNFWMRRIFKNADFAPSEGTAIYLCVHRAFIVAPVPCALIPVPGGVGIGVFTV